MRLLKNKMENNVEEFLSVYQKLDNVSQKKIIEFIDMLNKLQKIIIDMGKIGIKVKIDLKLEDEKNAI